MKKMIWGLGTILVLTLAMVTACNTVQGIGEDIESGGQQIQKAAH